MVTRTFAERFRDSYEPGMSIDEYVDFFKSTQCFAEEGDEFGTLTEEELRQLSELVIEINEGGEG